MTLQRAMVKWPPDRYYWLSPNGEEWLEVTEDTFNDCVSYEQETISQLNDMLEGKNGTSRLRFTRQYLKRLGSEPGKSITFY